MKNYRKKNNKSEIKRLEIKRLGVSLREPIYRLVAISVICYSLFTIHHSLFAAVMSGGDYKITRLQTGGVGSGFYEKDGVKLYHSFSQSSTVGAYETADIKLFSGYLIIGGYPLQVLGITPSANKLGVSISTFAKVYFDGEVNTASIPNAVNIVAIRDRTGRKISQAVPISAQYDATEGSIKITPQEFLSNNNQFNVLISTALTEAIDDLPLETTVQWKFTTILAPQMDNVTVSDFNENLKVEIPGYAFSDYYYTEISSSPLSSPIKVAPEYIRIATAKAVSNDIANEILGYYEFVPKDEKDEIISTKPAKQLGIALPFSQKQKLSPGLQSQSAMLRLRKNINLYRLNEEKKLWVRLPGVSVDTDNNLIKGAIPYFGTFAMFVDPSYYLGDVYAYPVPFSPNENPNHKTITFTNLATKCTIKVFTISGELVNEFEETDGDGEYTWTDVKNKDGESLASGVYLYLIESKQDHKVGKLMIIK